MVTNQTRFANYNWVLGFPRLLLKTWQLKIKNRYQNTNTNYILHLNEFFSMECLCDNSDKFASLRPMISKEAKGKSNQSVLEIATGNGFGAVSLESEGFKKVVAIDLVPRRIEECKKLFPKSKIIFEVADASKLPFKDKSFDASVASFGLHDMPRDIKRKAIEEMIRVTKNTVVIAEPRTFKNPVLAKVYGLVASLVDESMNVADYVADDLNSFLKNKCVSITDQFVWHNTLNLKTVTLINK